MYRWDSWKSLIIVSDGSFFRVCQFRKGDCSDGGTIFDAQLNQNALDMLADRFGAGAQDHTDLMISFTGRSKLEPPFASDETE